MLTLKWKFIVIFSMVLVAVLLQGIPSADAQLAIPGYANPYASASGAGSGMGGLGQTTGGSMPMAMPQMIHPMDLAAQQYGFGSYSELAYTTAVTQQLNYPGVVHHPFHSHGAVGANALWNRKNADWALSTAGGGL